MIWTQKEQVQSEASGHQPLKASLLQGSRVLLDDDPLFGPADGDRLAQAHRPSLDSFTHHQGLSSAMWRLILVPLTSKSGPPTSHCDLAKP